MAIIDNVQKISDTIWEIAFHLQECASRKSSGAFDHCAPLRFTAEPGQRRFDEKAIAMLRSRKNPIKPGVFHG
ncbi:MAG: hypothetical protein DME80_04405 [Verrucomicrobia bacterium]|nr:MAG: hypothetical protein DMC60_10575 [Verrucomicrobiota bacterium]PYI71003.1 MAG: hypothetical protein DMF02_07495 [Verrucomicrobiota bacterium]PYJ27189.1 MAG: hypothetical protein DME89_10000 [Verrucomicrobiota bacterium]PYJ45000.1 MAG: hypothetical protein DME80_04405 [Verrucomicrobiota bacterium]